MAKIIKQWHGEVRARRKKQDLNSSVQSARTSLSTDWSIRDSPSDFSSHHRPPPPTPTPAPLPLPLPSEEQNNHLPSTNRGEITEEKQQWDNGACYICINIYRERERVSSSMNHPYKLHFNDSLCDNTFMTKIITKSFVFVHTTYFIHMGNKTYINILDTIIYFTFFYFIYFNASIVSKESVL